MKFNRVLPFTLMCLGFSLTGCGNNNNTNNENTTMVETTTNSSISNNINGVFDGYRYNTDDYNVEYTTYDKNYYNGYERTTNSTTSSTNNSTTNSTNDRFGNGMKGAENIKGNENKTTSQKISSDINNMYNDTKNTYDNIKNSIMD